MMSGGLGSATFYMGSHENPEATKFKSLCRRTTKSHEKAITELKQELHMYLPPKKKGGAKKKTKNESELLMHLGSFRVRPGIL